jgi:Xaa-Pro aminopeptidase
LPLYLSQKTKIILGTVLLPATGTTYGINAAVSAAGSQISTGNCPVEYFKSIKNEVEIKWFRHYMLLDSVALSETLMIIENEIKG